MPTIYNLWTYYIYPDVYPDPKKMVQASWHGKCASHQHQLSEAQKQQWVGKHQAECTTCQYGFQLTDNIILQYQSGESASTLGAYSVEEAFNIHINSPEDRLRILAPADYVKCFKCGCIFRARNDGDGRRQGHNLREWLGNYAHSLQAYWKDHSIEASMKPPQIGGFNFSYMDEYFLPFCDRCKEEEFALFETQINQLKEKTTSKREAIPLSRTISVHSKKPSSRRSKFPGKLILAGIILGLLGCTCLIILLSGFFAASSPTTKPGQLGLPTKTMAIGLPAPSKQLPSQPTPTPTTRKTLGPPAAGCKGWIDKRTGLSGNRFEIWESIVKKQAPKTTWDTFKDQVLKCNPSLRKSDFVFVKSETYWLPIDR